MKQYLNYKRTKTNYSVSYGFGLVFQKIQTVLFSFLCVVFLISSRLGSDFSKDVSFVFVSVSLPIVKVASFPFNVVITLLTDFSELVDAKKENKLLREELEKLRSFYIKSLNIHQENKELRNTLNFVTAKTSSFKVAQIVGRSHHVFNQQVFIDAGENRQIKVGNIVTGNHGVVGRIEQVFKDKSRLILLGDARSRIPAITSKARVRGILSGNNSGTMELLYLPKKHGIEEGDWVFTSGDGDTLPPGLLVGVVKKVYENSALVVAVEDVNNIDVVTIIGY